MCTRPVTITQNIAGRVVARTVPCGKCAECRSVSQASFAALTLMESAHCSSFCFATLTYRDDALPWKSISEEYSALLRGIPYELDSYGAIGLTDSNIQGAWVTYAPTLFREDLKHHLKRFRKYLGERSKLFRYGFFGEYGSRRNRPHYHGLLFNLTFDEIDKFRSLWEKYYGSAKLISIPRLNPDGSDAYVKVSKYISKYVSKGSKLPDFVKDGYAERPRKMLSRCYGLQNIDLEYLRNFI